MWLGQEAMNLNNLFHYLSDTMIEGECVVFNSPIGTLVAENFGSIEFKKPGFLRKNEPGTIIFRTDKGNGGYFPALLLDKLETFVTEECPSSQAAITAFVDGVPYWFHGAISIELDSDSGNVFYINAGNITSGNPASENEPPKKLDFSGWIGSY